MRFKIADCVVVPSRYEPFGLTVCEGWAAGKVVVVSRREFVAELTKTDEERFVSLRKLYFGRHCKKLRTGLLASLRTELGTQLGRNKGHRYERSKGPRYERGSWPSLVGTMFAIGSFLLLLARHLLLLAWHLFLLVFFTQSSIFWHTEQEPFLLHPKRQPSAEAQVQQFLQNYPETEVDASQSQPFSTFSENMYL